jgi:uncharacterized protein YndB with AHSA1/START domain
MRIDEASRVIHASPSAIYGAFADPDALQAWLPPSGMTGRLVAFDFRDGGGYRMRLTYDDKGRNRGKSSNDADDVVVRFARLVEGEYIEQAVTFESADPRFSGVMTVSWSFLPTPSGTAVTVRCENVPDGIRPEDHEAGLASTLENLAAFTE